MAQYPVRTGPIFVDPAVIPPESPGYAAPVGFAEGISPGGVVDVGSTPIQVIGTFVPGTLDSDKDQVWISYSV